MMMAIMPGSEDPEDDLEVQTYLSDVDEALETARPIPLPPAEMLARLGEDGIAWLQDQILALRLQYEDRPRRFKRIGKPLGHGGMGVVFPVHDDRLGRDLALKVMRKRLIDLPEMAGRFQEEARISARLAHPSIVPVYDLGKLRDGRPWMAMMRITGENLHVKLDRRASPAEAISDWLSVFEQVSLAVAHAHGLDILHRDLKSTNVMIGNDGQVWVIDWGLAKVIDRQVSPVVADHPPHRPDAKGGSKVVERTSHGSVLGTYHSMSPEQARGEVSAVGKPSDVFGLGSILCEILTGSPAYVGSTREEIKAKATAAALDEAEVRLRTCGQDPELVALVRRCLREDQTSRPGDAGEVAKAVASYRRSSLEKLRKARRARWIGAAVLVGSVGLAIASVVVAIQARRAEQAERKLADAAGNQFQSIQALSRIAADPRFAQLGLTTIQADLLAQALPPLEAYRKIVGGQESDKLFSQALMRLADVLQTQGDPEKSLAVLTTAEGYFTHIVDAGKDHPDPEAVYGLAVVRASKGAVLGRSLGRTEEAIVLLRKAAETMTRLLQAGWGKPDEIRQRLALCRNNEANCLRFSDPDAAIVAYRQAIDAFRDLAESGPGAPGASVWLVKTGSNLGLELELAGKWAEAIEVHDEFARQGRDLVARVEAERAAVADPSSNSWMLAALAIREAFAIARFNQGACLDRLGKLKDAEPVLREALSAYEGLAQQVPENREFVWSVAMTQSELGKVMTRDGLGRWEQAAGLLSQSRAWYASNDKGEDSEFAFYRGEDLIRAVDLELRRPARIPAGSPTAMELARQAVAILEKAGNGPEATMDLAEARLLLGETLARSGDDRAAGKAWESARLGLDRLIQVSPKVPRFLLGLARVEARLGSLASREGREADAAGFRKSAQGHFEAARVESPDDPNLAEVEAELSVARPDSSTAKPAKAPG